MARTLKLDSTGDLAIENNRFVVIDKTDQIVQRLRTRLRSFTGEWFLALNEWIPYIDEVLVKNFNIVTLEGIFAQVIIDTPGVDRILNFVVNYDNNSRSLSLDWEVVLETGDVDTQRNFRLIT